MNTNQWKKDISKIGMKAGASKTLSKVQLAMCALALGIGAQFAPQTDAEAAVNSCRIACNIAHFRCIRNGGDQADCRDFLEACLAGCP
jgi:hypothetical protein